MSIKLTTQMDWKHHASYSKHHPDNMNRSNNVEALPTACQGPPPLASFNEVEKKVDGRWGHRLACERAYGPCETTTRIKDNVTNKVGSSWDRTITVERGQSTLCSSMYGGSLIERSFSTLANEGVGSLKR